MASVHAVTERWIYFPFKWSDYNVFNKSER